MVVVRKSQSLCQLSSVSHSTKEMIGFRKIPEIKEKCILLKLCYH